MMESGRCCGVCKLKVPYAPYCTNCGRDLDDNDNREDECVTRELRVAVSYLERRIEVHVIDAPENWDELDQSQQAQFIADQDNEGTIVRVDYSSVDDEDLWIETLS